MKKNVKYIPAILIFFSFILLLIKARYSFCWSDESFYLAVTSRFYKGDRIFYDEWFPTQLSSLLLLPLYSIYVAICKNTDGIILFFRILFVILELISATTVYKIMSKYHGLFLGTTLALLVQWYTHLNIATLSYYTMSTHFFVLSMVLIYDYYMSKVHALSEASKNIAVKEKLQLVIAGILFALCVLCLPTMCVAYFLIVFAGFIITILGRISKSNSLIRSFSVSLDFIHTFFYTLIGICVPAIIFAVYMLTHVSIPDFLSSLTYVLSDDEHELSKLYPLKKMYLAINESYGSVAKLAYLFVAISILVFFVMIISSILKESRITQLIEKVYPAIRLIVLVLDIVLFSLYLLKSFGHTGYIFTAMMLFSLPLFLITKKKNWRLFILAYIGGLLFSLVYSYSSNGMLYLLSMGHFICSIGGIVFVTDLANEIKDEQNDAHLGISPSILSSIISAIIIVCIVQTCLLRVTNIYRDDKLQNLTELTKVGPAKGLYTSSEHLDMYMNVYDTINKYCMSDSNVSNETLLISKLLPFGYLISDLKVAAPTVWRNPMGSLRLKEYYESHEDRYPDVILVLDEYYGSYETCGDVEADYIPNDNDSDGYMYDYIKDNNMTAIPVNCGIVYVK